jgi:hypothetical protein
MGSDVSSGGHDRVVERRRAVALARRYRDIEGLSIAEIARRVGRSPATVKAYFYDPAGEKARAVKARYVGVCRGCGAYTQPRNGKGDAYAYCKACHPGAIARRWTPELVLEAMIEWQRRFGRLPTSYDWSATHVRQRGGEALERLASREWPAASAVSRLFGTWVPRAPRPRAMSESRRETSVATAWAATRSRCVQCRESNARSITPGPSRQRVPSAIDGCSHQRSNADGCCSASGGAARWATALSSATTG